MRDHNSYEYGRREFHQSNQESAGLVLAVAAAIVVSLAAYLAVARFHIRPDQIIEASLYLLAGAATVLIVVRYLSRRKKRIEEAWPHPPVRIPMLTDERHVQTAFANNAIVLGYNVHGEPWLWSDEVRRMQAILLGQSGSGKTTLLENIAAQDIHRVVGTPGKQHHLPLIIFDGKGDQAFLNDLLPEIEAAGRMSQLRIVNPSRPDISVRINPVHSKDDSYQELVGAFFESFALRQDFFYGHQATYFNDVCRVLHHTGKIANIHDVLVMALDQHVMREQINAARVHIAAYPIGEQRRLNFEMSVRNLLQSLEDRERVPKIQGLINELMTFLDDDLSVVTGAYEDLLTLDDVIDQELILFVSLNTNKNSKAITALGRMLLQSLQLIVGKRYQDEPDRLREAKPMVSVILDEFAPFAYPNFAQILQTARGSNIAFLFSLQSVPQLLNVSRSFRADVSSAPNTVMMMRTRDQDTAQYFLDASARITGERRTVTVEDRGLFEEKYQPIGFGSITEIQKPRAEDYHIKNLPVGQMQVLQTDNRMGTLHSHLHVRRPTRYRLASLEPAIYPRLQQVNSLTAGANLRFRDPELARRSPRILGKNKVPIV